MSRADSGGGGGGVKRYRDLSRRFSLTSMKLTRVDGEPHAAHVTSRSNAHGILFPKADLTPTWMFNKSSNIFYVN